MSAYDTPDDAVRARLEQFCGEVTSTSGPDRAAEFLDSTVQENGTRPHEHGGHRREAVVYCLSAVGIANWNLASFTHLWYRGSDRQLA